MKVFDLTPQPVNTGIAGQLKERLGSLAKLNNPQAADQNAQETVIATLDKLLDRRYVMLRNVHLEALDIPIPLILMGPTCFCVINASGIKGIFQAKNDVWAEMNRTTRKYQPSKENILKRTVLLTQAVDTYLTRTQHPHPPIQPVLVFADSGAHVDTARPVVRVVLSDAIERLGVSLAQEREILKPEDIQALLSLFSKHDPLKEREDLAARAMDISSFAEPVAPAPKKSPRLEALQKADPLAKVKLSKKQSRQLRLVVIIEFGAMLAVIAAAIAAYLLFLR